MLGPCLAFARSSDSRSLVLPEALTTGLEIWFDIVTIDLLETENRFEKGVRQLLESLGANISRIQSSLQDDSI